MLAEAGSRITAPKEYPLESPEESKKTVPALGQCFARPELTQSYRGAFREVFRCSLVQDIVELRRKHKSNGEAVGKVGIVQNRYVVYIFVLGIAILAFTACGNDRAQDEPAKNAADNVANPDFDTVQSLVQEFASNPQKTESDACPVVKEEETSREGYDYREARKLSCYTQDDETQTIDAAIYWEFKDAAEAERFVEGSNTSAEFYLINDNVVVDGPVFNFPKGIYDSEEFHATLRERCDCGEVVRKG